MTLYLTPAGPYYTNQTVSINCVIDRVYPKLGLRSFKVFFRKNNMTLFRTKQQRINSTTAFQMGINWDFLASYDYQNDTVICQASTKRGVYSQSFDIQMIGKYLGGSNLYVHGRFNIKKTQRRQYEGHDNPRRYYTDQGTKGSGQYDVLWLQYCL